MNAPGWVLAGILALGLVVVVDVRRQHSAVSFGHGWDDRGMAIESEGERW
jgi:hypothetical protein